MTRLLTGPFASRTTSTSSPQAKSPAGSSAGAAAGASSAPGERTPTAHNKQLQNVKGQEHPPHPSVSIWISQLFGIYDSICSMMVNDMFVIRLMEMEDFNMLCVSWI